jgi:hypothetical protein
VTDQPAGPTPNLTPEAIGAMTPEQATSELAARKAAFDKANGPTTNSPAARRLQEIYSDPTLREQLLIGRPSVVSERDRLYTELAAGEAKTTGFETSTGPDGMTPRERSAAMVALDLPDETIAYIDRIDAGENVPRPTEGDAILAKRAMDRLARNPEWAKAINEGRPAETRLLKQLCRIRALSQADGREGISPEIDAFLSHHGLR